MLSNFLALAIIFLLDLTTIILPVIDDTNNSWTVKNYVIKNKKLLGNAMYSFVQSDLPLCSQRYQKISAATCAIENCNIFYRSQKNLYLDQAVKQELRDFCVIDSKLGKIS